MVATIKTYKSVEEIAETIDKEIADTKSSLGQYLSKLDAIRALAEKSKKVREIVMKLSGKKNGKDEKLGEIEIGDLEIILDANASHEMTAIEEVVRSHQEYLLALQNAREALKPLDQLGDTEGLKFMVLETRGVPERILLKTL
jgi:hypothetical protein